MNKSFTLIEILVVIVVIGILSALILVGTNSITSSASITKYKAFSESLRNSLLTNLVSEWKLDGSASDSWGTNNGTLNNFSGSPYVSSCPSGQCVQFDGVDDYISINDHDTLDIVNEITIEAWVNLEEVTGGYAGRIIIGKGGAYTDPYGVWTSQSAGSIMAMITIGGAASYGSSTNINLKNGWHLVGEIYNGSKLYSIYDGRILYIKDLTGNIDINANNLTINSTSVDRKVKGYIDMVRIYNKAQSSAQIKQKYYIGLSNLFKKDLISLGEFNQRISELKNNLTQN